MLDRLPPEVFQLIARQLHVNDFKSLLNALGRSHKSYIPLASIDKRWETILFPYIWPKFIYSTQEKAHDIIARLCDLQMIAQAQWAIDRLATVNEDILGNHPSLKLAAARTHSFYRYFYEHEGYFSARFLFTEKPGGPLQGFITDSLVSSNSIDVSVEFLLLHRLFDNSIFSLWLASCKKYRRYAFLEVLLCSVYNIFRENIEKTILLDALEVIETLCDPAKIFKCRWKTASPYTQLAILTVCIQRRYMRCLETIATQGHYILPEHARREYTNELYQWLIDENGKAFSLGMLFGFSHDLPLYVAESADSIARYACWYFSETSNPITQFVHMSSREKAEAITNMLRFDRIPMACQYVKWLVPFKIGMCDFRIVLYINHMLKEPESEDFIVNDLKLNPECLKIKNIEKLVFSPTDELDMICMTLRYPYLLEKMKNFNLDRRAFRRLLHLHINSLERLHLIIKEFKSAATFEYDHDVRAIFLYDSIAALVAKLYWKNVNLVDLLNHFQRDFLTDYTPALHIFAQQPPKLILTGDRRIYTNSREVIQDFLKVYSPVEFPTI